VRLLGRYRYTYTPIRNVPVITLDSVIPRLEGPALLKVDAEGYELPVLDGAVGMLPSIDMMILETRLFSYAEGLPEIGEVMSYAYAHGFVLYDVLDGGFRPLDGALELLDLVFVPVASALRREKKFARDGNDW
jgi:hypothetical protein